MQQYTRLVTPRFRRITIRFSGFEIELRTRQGAATERLTPEERAMRHSRAQETVNRQRHNTMLMWTFKA